MNKVKDEMGGFYGGRTDRSEENNTRVSKQESTDPETGSTRETILTVVGHRVTEVVGSLQWILNRTDWVDSTQSTRRTYKGVV